MHYATLLMLFVKPSLHSFQLRFPMIKAKYAFRVQAKRRQVSS